MKPVDFPAALGKLVPEEGAQGPDLPVWWNETRIVCCWQASWLGRLRFLFTGKIWMSFIGEDTQVQPHYPTTKNPFRREKNAKPK